MYTTTAEILEIIGYKHHSCSFMIKSVRYEELDSPGPGHDPDLLAKETTALHEHLADEFTELVNQ